MKNKELGDNELDDFAFDEMTPAKHYLLRNKLLEPLIRLGVYDSTPPDWFALLKSNGNRYRAKMAKALVLRTTHEGD